MGLAHDRTARQQAWERAAPLADADGHLAMISVDHRESLRTMMAGSAPPDSVPDDALRQFKIDAVHALGPHVSAVLVDRHLGADAIAALPAECALIITADVLHQERGGPVTGSDLDPTVTPEYVASVGAKALKLLVIWRAADDAARRGDLVERFLQLCRDCGVASLVEGLARPDGADWRDPDERHDAVLAAAADLTSGGPDVYKAEVPGYVPGDLSLVTEHSRRMDTIVGGPWVVLSSGVRREEYGPAIGAACRGGAAGFLAGRAVWGDVFAAEDPDHTLRTTSTARLAEYRHTVARETAVRVRAEGDHGGPA